MLTEALGLGSSLAVGVGDFIAGLQTRRHSLIAVIAINQATGLAALLPVTLLLGGSPPAFGDLVPALVAGLLGPLGMSALFSALAAGPMSVVAPISATSAALPVLAGMIAGEHPASIQIAGIALCAIGVIFAAAQTAPGAQQLSSSRRGIIWAIVAAPLMGTVIVLLGTTGDDALWTVTAFRLPSCVVVAAAAWALRTPIGEVWRSRTPTLMLIGPLDNLGLVLFLTAANRGLLSVTAVLFSLYPAVTVALARLLLAERLRRVQLAGATLIVVGIAALAVR